MEDILLKTLYEEHKRLVDRLSTVNETIIKLGGAIPNSLEQEEIEIPYATYKNYIDGAEYSKNFTWKQKIVYILNEQQEPCSAEKIATQIAINERLNTKEHNEEIGKIVSMVTQYCSAMVKDGILTVDGKLGKKNLYTVTKFRHSNTTNEIK